MTFVSGRRDHSGAALSADAIRKARLLNRTQKYAHSRGKDRSASGLDEEVHAQGMRLGLPRALIARAQHIGNQARETVKGVPFSLLGSVGLLLAAREQDNPLSAKDLTDSKKAKNRLLRLYRGMKSKLNLDIQLMRPETLVPRI